MTGSMPEDPFLVNLQKVAQAVSELSESSIHISDNLTTALTHSSFTQEHSNVECNEKLEFLGDSVLGLIVVEYIYSNFPFFKEGDLAKLKSQVVATSNLANAAKHLPIASSIRLGVGESDNGGSLKESILGDSVEALIGALYLDVGLERTKIFVLNLLINSINEASQNPGGNDAKSLLQVYLAKKGAGLPTYEHTFSGPDHQREFEATLYIDGTLISKGTGKSKKQAEQKAAEIALNTFNA